jgi:hypothetical protein
MKHLCVLFVALLLVPASLRAQQSASTTGVTPRTSAGDFALLFDLGGLAELALNGFNGSGSDTSTVGAGFGAKYFVADDLALRVGLAVQSSSANRPVDSVADDEFNVFRFAITPGVTFNLTKSGPVAGYVGGQISYAMSSSNRNPANELEPEVEATRSAFSIAALIGAEWFPWSSVSLAGEYQLGYGMSSSDETRTVSGQDPVRVELPTESSFGLGSRGVITAAIYW